MVGCAEDPAAPDEPTGQVQQGAYLRDDSVHHAFSVCWDSASYLQPWLRDAFQQGWAREANVMVSGWDNYCSQSSGDVHLSFWDNNFSRTDYPFPIFAPQEVIHFEQSMDYRRAVYTSVHEFGHVLGFEHEQNRGDSNESCDSSGGDGDFTYGPYDRYSVMNYCNDNDTRAAFGTDRNDRLSGWDIEAIRALDGAKPKGSISSAYGGQCWSSSGVGNYLVSAQCSASSNEAWRLNWGTGANTQTITLASNSSQCVTMTDRATQAACTGSAAQKFSAFDAGDKGQRGQIRGIAGKCLTRLTTPNEFGVGRDVVMSTCNGSDQQQWYVDGSGVGNQNTSDLTSMIRASEPGLCLDVKWNDPSSGNHVQIYPCDGNPAQQWQRQPNGQLNADGKCLSVLGENQNDGAAVGLWDCGSSPYEVWQWHRGMQLRGMGGKCLTSGDRAFGVAQAGTQYCDDSSSEWWIYEPDTQQLRSQMGLCLSVNNSFVVTTAACSTTIRNQRWSVVNGQVVSLYNAECLNVGTPDPSPLVTTAACNTSSNQVWSPAGYLKQSTQCLSTPYAGNGNIYAGSCSDSVVGRFDVH